jgi:hypothetical protein
VFYKFLKNISKPILIGPSQQQQKIKTLKASQNFKNYMKNEVPPFFPTKINGKGEILGKSYEIKLNIVKVDKLNVYLSL